MQNILVTGANGQLGQAIQLVAGKAPAFNFIYTDYEELDITNAAAVADFFAAQPIHACINCAAYTAVDKAESEEEKAFQLNFEAVLNLSDACREHNAQLIHISTDYVFDGRYYRPYTEEDEASPQGIYGASKLRGEAAALGNDPTTIVIRTSWLYSQFGVNFVKRIRELMQERPSLNIVFDQVGTPTYAVDLAQAVLDILGYKAEHPEADTGGVYHYSNEGVISWYDFAVAVKELTGSGCEISPITSDQYPTPAQRPAYSVLNKKKIKETFGVKVPYWKESLKVCLEKL